MKKKPFQGLAALAAVLALVLPLSCADGAEVITRDALEKLERFMNENPKAYAMVSGYSCILGSDEANREISRARAAVSACLTDRANNAPETIVRL